MDIVRTVSSRSAATWALLICLTLFAPAVPASAAESLAPSAASSVSPVAVPSADTNGDGEIRLGAVSDVEGVIDNARVAAERLRAARVDLVVVAGDLYEDEGHRRHPLLPQSTDNVREMVEGLRPFAALGVPVYVIPGNHESRAVFAAAMAVLTRECPNVTDINGRSVDLLGLNLVGMGGFPHAGHGAPDSFVIGPADFAAARERIERFVREQPGEPVVFVSHCPPLGTGLEDYIPIIGHRGDPATAAILNAEPCWHLCGHLHQNGGTREDFARGTSFNVASITPYYNPMAPNDFVFRVTPAGLVPLP